MNRRTYLGSLASLGGATTAGCLTRIGNSEEVDGPTIDAEEYMITVDDLNTDWLYAPNEEEGGYDFGFVNPNAVLAMDTRFADIGAYLQLAGSRYLTFWRSIDQEQIDQLTFIDRREVDGEYEAGAVVAEGEVDREAVLAEAPEFEVFAEQELVDERQVGETELLVFDSGDLVGVGDGFVILSIEPFRQGRNRLELVERVLAARHGDRERYFQSSDDLTELFSWFEEAHIYEGGTGPRLDDGPSEAIATGESISIRGSLATIFLVAVFENDADAEHATQFDPSFETLAENALTADTQLRGRTTITEQRLDIDTVNARQDENAGLEPLPGGGVQ